MPGKVALVAWDKCRVKECADGICIAARACTRRLLNQEAPYETPLPHPNLCRGCGDCMRACPHGAIQIVAM